MLRLSEEIAQEIRDHGARDYPNETCGAMLGVDGIAGAPAATPARSMRCFRW